MKEEDYHYDPSFLEDLLERLTDQPSMILDCDGTILFFNSNSLKVGDVEGKSLEGSHVKELFPEKSREQATRTFFANSSRGKNSVFAVTEMGNGKTKDILWNVLYKGKSTEKEEIAICVGNPKNKTYLEDSGTKDYRETKEEAKLYKTLFEYAYDAIIFSRFGTGRIFEANPEAEKLFGYSSEELLGKDLSSLFASNDLSSLKQNLQKDDYFYKEQQNLIANDGSRLIASMSASLVEYRGQKTILSLFHDITKRVNLEKKLRNRAESLQESKERLEELIHIISHDLKEPLRSIGTYSDMLFSRFEDKLEGDYYRRLEKLKENSTRLKRMLDNVSNLTKVSLEDSPTRIDVPELVDEIVGEMAFDSREVSIDVQGDFPKVKYDRFQLKVIFRNGISNAFKHNDPPRHIYIGFQEEPEDSDLTLFIEDNGHGFKKDHEERVFRMFEQLDPKDDSVGMGAGLAFCKRIVNSHEGEIYLNTEVGEGTTLYFTVPRAGE